MTTIMIGPPTNSATVNCQPISRARITPSSITRLVEAISNAIAAVKSAPLRNSARASATAAYEHEDDAAPSPAATASVRGRASPSSRTIVDRRTTAWITAESANPRISAQVISQVIDPVMDSAWTTACMPLDLPRQPADDTKLYPHRVYDRPCALSPMTDCRVGGDPMRRHGVYCCQMTAPQME